MATVEFTAIETDQPVETTPAGRVKFKIELALFLIACHRMDEAAQTVEQAFDILDAMVEAGH